MKFLIIRLSSIGDIVLTTALIRVLRNQYKDAQIDFLTDKAFKDILINNPYIDNLILYDKTKSIKDNSIIKKDLDTDYNIIDLQNNLRSILFRKSLGSYVKLNKKIIQKFRLVHFKNKPKSISSIPIDYINSAAKFNIKYDDQGLEFWLPDEKQSNVYPPNLRQDIYKLNRIAVAPGAKHFTKRWNSNYFVELINKINSNYNNIEFYLIGGKDDKAVCQEIFNKTKTINSSINIVDYSGQTSLIATASIIDKVNLMISNDTGVMHIAAARKIPVTAIFGSTTKDFGFSPFGVPYIICENNNLTCRPCSHIGRHSCPKGHFDCMNKLTAENVFSDLQQFIKLHY